MSFNETSQPKLISNFSLPYLKDILPRDRIKIMDERWGKTVMKEMYEALDCAEEKWARSVELLNGRLLSVCEIRAQAIDWGNIVTAVILSFRNDAIAIAEVKGIDTREMHRETWEIARLLKSWRNAICTESDMGTVREFARQGIEFLKRADLSPEKAFLEYKLAIAKEIKSRTDF